MASLGAAWQHLIERNPRSLTHWGRVTHICVSKLTSVGSDNGLSPGRREAIIWTNAEILLIGPLGKNLSEILIGIRTFWFQKMRLKVSSGKLQPFCLGLNVLTGGYNYMCALVYHSAPPPHWETNTTTIRYGMDFHSPPSVGLHVLIYGVWDCHRH